MKRRDFLKAVGALSSASMLSACGKKGESEKLISYLVPPEDGVIPGEAVFTPSTCTECPAHCGVLVKTIDGLPKKLEGMPGHPVNDGGLCMRGQAALFRLYHPDRIKTPLMRTPGGAFQPVSWDKAFERIVETLKKADGEKRSNLYLSGRTTGTLTTLIERFCTTCGTRRSREYEYYSHAALREAYRLLFRVNDLPRYRIQDADFLLTLGADILETFISPVSFGGQIARDQGDPPFTWTHIEPHFSLTGMNATERHTIRPGTEPDLLLFLLQELLKKEEKLKPQAQQLRNVLPSITLKEVTGKTGLDRRAVKKILRRLATAERPLLMAGGVSTGHAEGLEVALLAALIQWSLGMHFNTIDFSRSENYGQVGSINDMRDLLRALGEENVGVLFFSRTNPVRHLTPEYAFKDKLQKAALRVGFGDFMDETLRETDLVLPLSHSLESWGDAEPRRGVASLIQPILKTQYDTLSEGDILLQLIQAWTGEPLDGNYQDTLFASWKERFGESGTKEFVEKGYREIAVPEKEISLDPAGAIGPLNSWKRETNLKEPVLIITPSIRTFDGRSRTLPLLYEIPDPLTTITYGRWVSLSPADAGKLGIREKEEVTLSVSGWSTTLAVKIQPGLPGGALTLQQDILDAAPLQGSQRSGEIIQYMGNVSIRKSGSTVAIPVLSGSLSQRGRGLIPVPGHHGAHKHKRVTLYPAHQHKDYRWAMAVDLDRCIGCSACVAACHIENNVPIVGREEHLKGREMSWLRIEPYYNDGKAEFLPMMCQQCHDAPCETVCPVYAAYHNPEGLNVQLYNRCVGTRYCSNNCPYKVRRFNWFEHRRKPPLDKMYNPEMFVRWKGVMEKCTFCIQRIRKAHDTAKDEARKIRDGEVITACAQSCPTGAIVFGNSLDKQSKVYRLAHSERAYRVFEGLGTEPSVYYLKKHSQEI